MIMVGVLCSGNTNTIIRETSFVSNNASNNQGHDIFTDTHRYDQTNPHLFKSTISIINTHFSDQNRASIFYDSGSMVDWQNCSSNLCTEPPFIGRCTPANVLNEKVWSEVFSSWV